MITGGLKNKIDNARLVCEERESIVLTERRFGHESHRKVLL